MLGSDPGHVMVIGIDARTTENQYKGRGICNYTKHIIGWLPKIDPSVEVYPVESRRAGAARPPFHGVDVFLQPNFWDGFPMVSCPRVLMVHDLTPLATKRFSEKGMLANFLKGLLYRWKLRNIKKADAIIVNSDNTKKDVIRFVGVEPEVVHRVYLGVDEAFRTAQPVPREERGNYILFVGGVEANKNVLRLLEAFSTLNPKPSTLRLIMPGGQFVDEKKIETRMVKAKIEELELEGVVEFPGFVPQKDLIELYRKALVFVYPSYYEGFGFPVLEAMGCGTPVVCSNASSLPEVGGDAVIYVDPFDVESIAEGIKEVLYYHTTEYGKYQELVQKGLQQSQKFSWEICARETLEVLYENCVGA